MRETPKAKRAWADYLALGVGRSLEALSNRYQTAHENGTQVPTLRLKTLADWSVAFGWQERLAEIADAEAKAIAAARAAIVQRGLAELENQIAALNDRWRRLRQVIGERGADESLADVPGGTTGLMVRTYKAVGRRVVEEFAVDTGLLAELRAHEKQAAELLGLFAPVKVDVEHIVREKARERGIDEDQAVAASRRRLRLVS